MNKPHKSQAVMAKDGPSDRHRLVVELGTAIRKMGAQSVITSRTVADRFGLHMTDLEVLDLIFLRKQASAGELADATGLSSGAVTALIDRLAAAGYVERCEDPHDRRRVIVRIRQEAIEPIKNTYLAMQKRMFELWSSYGARDLETITDFVTRSTTLAVDCCKSIRLSRPKESAKRRAARMGSRSAAEGSNLSAISSPTRRRKSVPPD
jgi:DNA-binding MarR family transcriptional regulator